jgi:hypothetical protein
VISLVQPHSNVREYQLHVLIRLACGEAVSHSRIELDGPVCALVDTSFALHPQRLHQIAHLIHTGLAGAQLHQVAHPFLHGAGSDATSFITSKVMTLILKTSSGPRIIFSWVTRSTPQNLQIYLICASNSIVLLSIRFGWSLFIGNKLSRRHMECELYNLVQGEMVVHNYCHIL